MATILIALICAFVVLATNYIALIYGLKLGKSMQKDIPEQPFKPVVNAVAKGFKLIREKKSYIKKKEKKEEVSIFDY